ncbi:hypothetical protein BED47_18460 [Gottfriedia luciferensis]|uniref:DUF58 domain-containing protein n=1 Tax=Gottfriedia luciferensis TaxID=178774 RepID=A0ABX2ZVV0_9BACI|nr:DUF58 domain-containing protein [Gottfriedia luciferensis]ODG92667.1 hypothetical protein BED47_18460 [Gottfriedia luciferensis]
MKIKLRFLKKARKYLLLYVLLPILFLNALFQGGFVSWFLFYSFLPFILYCVAFSFYPLENLKVTRELPENGFKVGDPIKVILTMKKSNFFPVFYFLIVENYSNSLQTTNQQKFTKELILTGFKKECSFNYLIYKLPRGEYIFNSLTIKVGDPLGIFESKIKFNIINRFVVYPQYSEYYYHSLEHQNNQASTVSIHHFQRDISMAVGIREYQSGDRFSWINWKASAKRNEMMTKEFEELQSNDLFVIMDCAQNNLFESIVSFTASFLHTVLKKGIQVGLLTNNKKLDSFPIRGGEGHFQKLYYHLAKIEANNTSSIEMVLEKELRFIQQSVSYILITTRLSKNLVEKASFIKNRKGSFTIFVIKEESMVVSESEKSLISIANAHGVRTIIVREGNFNAAFTGGDIR